MVGGEKDEPKTVMRFRVVRIEPKRFVELCFGLAHSVETGKDEAKIGVSAGILRRQLLRTLEFGQRVAFPALLRQGYGELSVCLN